MTHARLVTLVLLLCVGIPVAAPAHAAPIADRADAVTVPVEITENGHVRVVATINGVATRLVLDTGASHNVLDSAAAARCKIADIGTTINLTGGGKVSAFLGKINTLTVAAHTQTSVPFVVTPLPPALQSDGILGKPFFDAVTVTIDYAAKTVTLADPKLFVPPVGALKLPLDFDGATPTVPAVVNGEAVRFQVDTGAANTVTFFPPFVQKRDLLRVFAPSLPENKRALGGELTGVIARVPSLILGTTDGGIRISGMEGYLLAPQKDSAFTSKRSAGSLGSLFWARFTVTLDYKHKAVYATKNADTDKPFPVSRSGMAYTQTEGGGTITTVLPQSAASSAGLVVGDVIRQVDGLPVGDANRSRIRGLFRQPAGTPVKLLVQSADGKARHVILTLRDVL